MLEAVRWKIWYDDGTTYSSDDGPAEHASPDGVIAVVEKLANKRTMIHSGADYYYWNGENWVSGGLADLEKWLRAALPDLKFGRWTRDGIFREMLAEAGRWP